MIATTLSLDVFTQRNCSRLFSTGVEFYSQKQQNRGLCYPLRDLSSIHTSNNVEATFDFVETTFYIVVRIVKLVAFDNVA